MIRSLYVLRHAKAEAGGSDDHERALRRRGRHAARGVGLLLRRLDQAPDLVLSSTAVRARDTARLALQAGELGAALELHAELYESTPEAILRVVSGSRPDARRVLLVGHEPGLSLTILELCGSEPEFPTAALARLDLDLERWTDLERGCARLVWLVTPEMLEVMASTAR